MEQTEKATFAGGCFWCMVKPFDQMPGIKSVISGYSGGHIENPTYRDVKKGDSGHYEVVQITFDPAVFSYKQLLELYWPQIDPTDDGGQFHDRGDSYRTAIFYHTEWQREMAEESRKVIEDSGRFAKPIVTKVLPAAPFYPAEEYHQDYYKKNPNHYKADRAKSGRDEFIEEHWEESLSL
ncbi:peptide-methionine (S)-S-oxide reductase MsrA [Bacillus sp. AK031]